MATTLFWYKPPLSRSWHCFPAKLLRHSRSKKLVRKSLCGRWSALDVTADMGQLDPGGDEKFNCNDCHAKIAKAAAAQKKRLSKWNDRWLKKKRSLARERKRNRERMRRVRAKQKIAAMIVARTVK